VPPGTDFLRIGRQTTAVLHLGVPQLRLSLGGQQDERASHSRVFGPLKGHHLELYVAQPAEAEQLLQLLLVHFPPADGPSQR
jgi:hypothetical protein